MKDDHIQVSEKHGINPSICLCPICRKDNGIVILGKLKGDIKAPKYIIGRDLCDECKKQVSDGKMFFIEVNNTSDGKVIGYTGRTIIMNKEDAKRLINDDEIAVGYIYIKEDDFKRIFGSIINSQKGYENSKTVS